MTTLVQIQHKYEILEFYKFTCSDNRQPKFELFPGLHKHVAVVWLVSAQSRTLPRKKAYKFIRRNFEKKVLFLQSS